MEVLLGSVITFAIIFCFQKLFGEDLKNKQIKIRYSQSHIFSLMPLKNFFINEKSMPITQSTRHHDQNSRRIIFYDNLAYWISDNALVSAEIIEGDFKKENAKPVDTINMDRVQLDNIKFIVEKLTEGIDNDHRNSGN